jgi:hypothetical protein
MQQGCKFDSRVTDNKTIVTRSYIHLTIQQY